MGGYAALAAANYAPRGYGIRPGAGGGPSLQWQARHGMIKLPRLVAQNLGLREGEYQALEEPQGPVQRMVNIPQAAAKQSAPLPTRPPLGDTAGIGMPVRMPSLKLEPEGGLAYAGPATPPQPTLPELKETQRRKELEDQLARDREQEFRTLNAEKVAERPPLSLPGVDTSFVSQHAPYENLPETRSDANAYLRSVGKAPYRPLEEKVSEAGAIEAAKVSQRPKPALKPPKPPPPNRGPENALKTRLNAAKAKLTGAYGEERKGLLASLDQLTGKLAALQEAGGQGGGQAGAPQVDEADIREAIALARQGDARARAILQQLGRTWQ